MIFGIPIIGEEMELIEDVSPTSGTDVTFAGISQNYDDLVIVCRQLTCDAAGVISIWLNGDETATNYAREFWRHYPSAVEAASAADSGIARAGSDTSSMWSGFIWIPRYSDGVYKKCAQGMGGFGGTGLNNWRNAAWNNVAAINHIKLKHDKTTWVAPTRFLLYGIRHRRTQ